MLIAGAVGLSLHFRNDLFAGTTRWMLKAILFMLTVVLILIVVGEFMR
ncbi:hypothetical protein L248_0274 [Schleiferilactobacillus shenzhenensis LY-73]|uniref:Uncharacterized protein n=1 Tax=Schleiferilactobacillus shenzhenensis LY-73 TaxID=1231336 RepID=U4TT44_9LACO|nr:hypothetical protein L248_0274 [Schleiferilactobacillus shenzhenensis LY-73]